MKIAKYIKLFEGRKKTKYRRSCFDLSTDSKLSDEPTKKMAKNHVSSKKQEEAPNMRVSKEKEKVFSLWF